MICPECNEDFRLGDQVADADDEFWRGKVAPAPGFPVTLSVECGKCGAPSLLVQVVTTGARRPSAAAREASC